MYENSNAYLRHHSCETALNNLIESWRKARDGKFVVNILSTEMSRAFDSFHPPLLLSKLNPRKYKGVCVWGGGGVGGWGWGGGEGGLFLYPRFLMIMKSIKCIAHNFDITIFILLLYN